MAADQQDLPQGIQFFLDRHIPSIAHLEMLFFLFDHRDRAWSASELSRELRTNEGYVIQQANGLSAFVSKETDCFKYQASEENSEIIRRLADLYRERRHALINAIYAKPFDAVRNFADAFKFKKDEGGK